MESLEEVTDTEIKAHITCVQSQKLKFDFYYGVALGELTLHHNDNSVESYSAKVSMTYQHIQQLKDKMLLG